MIRPVCVGVPPVPGDEALISPISAPNVERARWLLVAEVHPCHDPAWLWLNGRWTADPGADEVRVMVWADRLLVRKPHLT